MRQLAAAAEGKYNINTNIPPRACQAEQPHLLARVGIWKSGYETKQHGESVPMPHKLTIARSPLEHRIHQPCLSLPFNPPCFGFFLFFWLKLTMRNGHFEDLRVATVLYTGPALPQLQKEWIKAEWQWRNMITQPRKSKIERAVRHL